MDRKKSGSGDEQLRSAAGDRGRGDFGDDGGTRVGRPDPAEGAEGAARGEGDERQSDGFSRGPSTRVVKEGLEGAVLDDDEGDDRKLRARTGATGAGNEAARGIHDAQADRAPEDAGGIVDPGSDAIGSRGGMDRRGSEPLEGRDREHESGYGGKMGEPRK